MNTEPKRCPNGHILKQISSTMVQCDECGYAQHVNAPSVFKEIKPVTMSQAAKIVGDHLKAIGEDAPEPEDPSRQEARDALHRLVQQSDQQHDLMYGGQRSAERRIARDMANGAAEEADDIRENFVDGVQQSLDDMRKAAPLADSAISIMNEMDRQARVMLEAGAYPFAAAVNERTYQLLHDASGFAPGVQLTKIEVGGMLLDLVVKDAVSGVHERGVELWGRPRPGRVIPNPSLQ